MPRCSRNGAPMPPGVRAPAIIARAMMEVTAARAACGAGAGRNRRPRARNVSSPPIAATSTARIKPIWGAPGRPILAAISSTPAQNVTVVAVNAKARREGASGSTEGFAACRLRSAISSRNASATEMPPSKNPVLGGQAGRTSAGRSAQATSTAGSAKPGTMTACGIRAARDRRGSSADETLALVRFAAISQVASRPDSSTSMAANGRAATPERRISTDVTPPKRGGMARAAASTALKDNTAIARRRSSAWTAAAGAWAGRLGAASSVVMAPLCQIGAMGARCWLGCAGARLGKGRKRFFFEKKNQKTLARPSPASPRQPCNSFCFFFQKEALSCLATDDT